MHRLPLDHLVGQVGVTNEFRAHRRARSTECPLELLPLENVPQSRTYQPAPFRVVIDDQDIPAPRFAAGSLLDPCAEASG